MRISSLKSVSIRLKKMINELIQPRFDDNFFYFSHELRSTQEIEILADYLLKNGRMTSVGLNLGRNRGMGDQGLEILGKAFRGNSIIKEIAIDFFSFKDFTDKELVNFTQCFNPLVVQSIRILFRGQRYLTETGFDDFFKAMEKLVHLRFLYLDFEYCRELGDLTLRNIARYLKKMKKLEDLTLDFSICRWLTDQCFLNLKPGLKELSSLEKLSLSFNGNELLTDKGLISLGEGLKNLKKLDRIDLFFTECPRITSEGHDYLYGLNNKINMRYTK